MLIVRRIDLDLTLTFITQRAMATMYTTAKKSRSAIEYNKADRQTDTTGRITFPINAVKKVKVAHTRLLSVGFLS